MPTAVEKAEKLVALCETNLSLAKQAVVDAVKRTEIACKKCGHKMVVGSLTVVEEQWYREPYGCTGGDYWCRCDERWVACTSPSCKAVNRFFNKQRNGEQLKVLQSVYVGTYKIVFGKQQREEYFKTREWVQ